MVAHLVNTLEGHDSESVLDDEGLLCWWLPNRHRTTSQAISAEKGDSARDTIGRVQERYSEEVAAVRYGSNVQ